MFQKISYFIIFTLFVLSQAAYAQQSDSIKKDSARIYRKIEYVSRKSKISRFIYPFFFRSLPCNGPDEYSSDVKKKIIRQQYYNHFQGKIIRNINITSFDPFGYDSNDTTKVPLSILEKSANALHVKSRRQTIKRLLIIKQNDNFDSLRVRESERLIRSQSFIHEVIFTPVLTSQNSDSVDIYIRVYDVWSIIVNTDISKSSFNVDIKDKNILGQGHEFQNIYNRNYNTGAEIYRTHYYVPNIHNTYISALIAVDIDEKNNYNRSLSINRPFFSAFTKWAGGIYYLQHFNKAILYNPDSTPFNQNYKYNMQDYWSGKAWRIQRGNTEDARTTNLILSGRVYTMNYLEKPAANFDSLHLYSNEVFYFTAISVSRRRYDPDHYIFKYGITEDVPVGRSYSWINGYQVRNGVGRFYMGARIFFGQYYPCGYFSSNLEYGTFFHNAIAEEGSLIAGINYFTNILNIGRWKIRQFVKPQCTVGFNRLPYDNLSINNELGIRGFNSTGLSGNSQKVVLTLQTQSYAPWNLWGFRFGPYLISSFGMLGNAASGFSHSRVYSQYGIGFLIRNEYLIYHSIQISVAYYPTIPGSGNNVFKINPVKTTDFGLRDFDIGRPTTIAYQ
jgi:hypothetical protein